MPSIRSIILIAVIVLTTVHSVLACSVPVFAYALRRWPQDPHVLAAKRDEAWLAKQQVRIDAGPANLAAIPASAEYAPGIYFGEAQPCWLPGELDEGRCASIIDSPARRKLVQRLVKGESMVWLHLVDADGPAADEAEAKLRKRLDYLLSITTLAPLDPYDPATVRTMRENGPALRLSFGIQRVKAKDAAEWAFVAQLRALCVPDKCQGDLFVPVYGRTRALAAQACLAWTDEQIDDVVLFLTGICACQVKAENPGIDLLVSADWDKELAAVNVPWDEEGAPEAKPETVVFSPAAGDGKAAPSASPPAPNSPLPDPAAKQDQPEEKRPHPAAPSTPVKP